MEQNPAYEKALSFAIRIVNVYIFDRREERIHYKYATFALRDFGWSEYKRSSFCGIFVRFYS